MESINDRFQNISLFLRKHKQFVFSAVYFFGWAAYATSPLDYVFYSQEVGFSNAEIGTMLAFLGLIGLIAQPVAGLLCDMIKNTKKVILALMFFGIGLSAVLPFADSKTSVIIVLFFYSLFMTSFWPLFDNWVARECIGAERFHFGSIRLWGSIGFAIVAFIYGRIALHTRVSVFYFGRAAFLLITALIIYFFATDRINSRKLNDKIKNKFEDKSGGKPDIKRLLLKKEYICLLIFAFIFCMPLAASSNFFSKKLLSVGGDNSSLGLFYSINALVEIPFFLYVKKLSDKIGPRGLMLIGCGFITLRVTGFIFVDSIPLLLFTNMLVVPYTCFFMPGLIYYIYSIAPKNTEAFAQTLVQAAGIALSGMLGNILGGNIIDSFGLDTMYICCAALNMAGIFIFVVTGFLLRNNKAKIETEPETV